MEKKILYHIGLYGFRKLIVYVIVDGSNICESITEEDFLQELENPTF